MKKKKPGELLQKLIENRITRQEFEMLVEEVDDEESAGFYGEYLKRYFDKIMEEHKPEKEDEMKEHQQQSKNK